MYLSTSQVINKIKETNNYEFHLDFSREKNRDTAYIYNLRKKDIIELIKQVDRKHFHKCFKCDDKRFNIDYWYEFKMNIMLKNIYGEDELVNIYIKLGFCDGKIKVYVRSFHKDDEC